MSEFAFDNNTCRLSGDLSDLEDASHLAAYIWVMPLQRITATEEDGIVAVLACQHKQLLLPAFREEGSMRCLECYNERMRSAQKMIDAAGS